MATTINPKHEIRVSNFKFKKHMDIFFLLPIIILIMSVVIHEISHGYVAEFFGDPTARHAGRLTINPVPHIDLFGSIILPGLLALTGSSFLVGWAKPVPYNPYNFSNQRWGEAIVSAAGPLANIFLALVFSIVIRLQGVLGLSDVFVGISLIVVVVNLVLAVINFIPIPPIDGSKIVKAVLPYHLAMRYSTFEDAILRIGPLGILFALLALVLLFGPLISTAVFSLVSVFTGLSFVEIATLFSLVAF